MDISIIIPVYNAEKYIVECLESAVKQNVERKEIIVVYDNKEENSLPIIRDYAKRYNSIKFYQQHGAGPSSARNYGIAKARGKYIAFLDADDYYLDKFALEKMINAAETLKVDICSGWRQTYNEFLGKQKKHSVFRKLGLKSNCSMQLRFDSFQNDFHFHSYIYKREMLISNGVIFPTKYPVWEDPVFLLQALLVANKIGICGVEFYCYRYLNHIPVYGRRLEFVLKAIKHNMFVANQQKLYILQFRLISRLNKDYYDIIRENLSVENIEILLAIDNLKIIDQPIKILNDICDKKSSKEAIFLNKFVYILQRGKGVAKELHERGIENVAVYGAGNYGELFYRECVKGKIKVTAVFDSYKTGSWHGMKIFNKKIETVECDCIIATPLNHQEIEEKLRKKVSCRVISFVELVNDIYLKTNAEQ